MLGIAAQAGPPGARGVKFWIDAQLSPQLAEWLHLELGIEAIKTEGHGVSSYVKRRFMTLRIPAVA